MTFVWIPFTALALAGGANGLPWETAGDGPPISRRLRSALVLAALCAAPGCTGGGRLRITPPASPAPRRRKAPPVPGERGSD